MGVIFLMWGLECRPVQWRRLAKPLMVFTTLSWWVLSLTGCSDMVLLHPKGSVGESERTLILTALGLMLIVVIPVIVMTLVFAWRYRASNRKAEFDPGFTHSVSVEMVVWLVPCLIIAALAIITWFSTHELDPYKPLDSDKQPIRVQVVSMDWKWLFIYPDENIASVNELAFPVDTPVSFDITSTSVMNAFFIPQLGSQIYSMAGMNTQLHLMATEAGSYDGISANYSGAGFSDMHFKALALSDEDYQQWVAEAEASTQVLNKQTFMDLVKPSEQHPVEYFSAIEGNVYHMALNLFGASHAMRHQPSAEHDEHSVKEKALIHNQKLQNTANDVEASYNQLTETATPNAPEGE